MTIQDLLAKLDFSHCYTTAKKHCEELYYVAQYAASQSGAIVELGSYKGISTACIALGAGKEHGVISYDLCDEIPNSARLDFWRKLGFTNIEARQGDCAVLLASGLTPCFIFHDAAHGPQVLPEYEALWDMLNPGGCLCIHDAEQVDRAQLEDATPGCKNRSYSHDDRNRVLAVFQKENGRSLEALARMAAGESEYERKQ